MTRWTLCMSIGEGVFTAEQPDGTSLRHELRGLDWPKLEQWVRG